MGWLEINQIEEKIKSSEMGWFKINQIEQNKKTNKQKLLSEHEWMNKNKDNNKKKENYVVGSILAVKDLREKRRPNMSLWSCWGFKVLRGRSHSL